MKVKNYFIFQLTFQPQTFFVELQCGLFTSEALTVTLLAFYQLLYWNIKATHSYFYQHPIRLSRTSDDPRGLLAAKLAEGKRGIELLVQWHTTWIERQPKQLRANNDRDEQKAQELQYFLVKWNKLTSFLLQSLAVELEWPLVLS